MLEIKKIDVLSLAKIIGLIYAFFGLLIGMIFSLMSLLGLEPDPSGPASSFGVAAIIMFPLVYALAGFLSGILTALFYNLSTKWVGGLKMEMKQQQIAIK